MDKAILLSKIRQAVAEEWQTLVKKYQLKPGNISEELVGRIMDRLLALSE